MAMKEDNIRKIGFTRLEISRPGIIFGNAHTPAPGLAVAQELGLATATFSSAGVDRVQFDAS